MRALILVVLLSGCANYNPGDISARYCNSKTPEARVALKSILAASGVDVGMDYCTTKGLVDILAGTNVE